MIEDCIKKIHDLQALINQMNETFLGKIVELDLKCAAIQLMFMNEINQREQISKQTVI